MNDIPSEQSDNTQIEFLKSSKKGKIDLLDIKSWRYWINRIKYDTPFFISFFILFFLDITVIIILNGLSSYIESAGYLNHLVYFGSIIFLLYILNKGPKVFLKTMKDKANIFETEVDFINYLSYFYKICKSKLEFYLPIVIAIIYEVVIISIYNDRFSGILNLTGWLYVLNILQLILGMVWMFIFVLLIASGVLLLFSFFKGINALGDKFSLRVTFRNLKLGYFDDIGKFIMSVSIPTILFSTFYSILGFYIIVVIRNLFLGYAFMGISIVLTIIISSLLYKNTLNIHNSIVLSKKNLKISLLKDIDALSSLKSKSKYDTLEKINIYYDRIESISDWPFNPKSIKKLVITLGSSVVPLLLSFIGLL